MCHRAPGRQAWHADRRYVLQWRLPRQALRSSVSRVLPLRLQSPSYVGGLVLGGEGSRFGTEGWSLAGLEGAGCVS